MAREEEKLMRWLIVLLAFLLAIPTAFAQPRGGRTPAERREAVKKKIRALRAYTLTEELALDEKTAAKLFPVLARWDDVTDKLLVQRANITRQLATAGASKDPRAVDKLIDDAVANQKAFWDLEDKRLAELRKILTPAQTARLIVVLPAFERRIQNQLRRVIQNRRGGAALDDLDYAPDDDDAQSPPGRPMKRGRPAGPRSNAPGATKPCDLYANPHGC